MARFTRIEVVLSMKECGIVPVFYHPNPEVCWEVVYACYKAGVRVFEFTNRGDNAHKVFDKVMENVISLAPDMKMGVGSVVDDYTASLYIQNGADFIVSPILNAEIAKRCNRRKVAWMPGCGSASEISYAEELGAEVVKIFPGLQVGGPEFVKAVKAPMPWSSIMPTGGVQPKFDELQEWFKAGVHCVGLGSQLLDKSMIEFGDYEALTQHIQKVFVMAQEARGVKQPLLG
ncbi:MULTISPECIES: bifunctional 4-hydroxy-2-oxoglutarate aldolase/2-dehydro-3-deoxy-phosphogluconate aldolase [Flammeovirga]|uniref:Bifunctional 4-hydroxy-2-oxoglutarate aldolase/2-dehydro-3-deoxy-phosphogluconate aldolase n=1 Tax=Flammeovirga agarivorans TaxID=2726742 RepID=A0A7X8XYT3_9BACT|nr:MULTISPECIES: bifunctional 4-hydroxy-2-oxoglutarate aldolase/2-dehydro-3-deoxy-phosphogluconate aldolase [Flammeovirga]NLR94325.1 bifunctional 4-hydroxy-2-oxoglutarate aldolase/2-dehydro-3-deoxy-phosphogluconate aldolase [Flammeovirga agarivorans]